MIDYRSWSLRFLLLALFTTLLTDGSIYSPTASAQLAGQVTMFPTSGPPGTNVTANGSGFMPGEQVRITFFSTPTGVLVGQQTASPNGTFSGVAFTIPSLAPGSYQVRAVGLSSEISGSAQFLVTQGNQPPCCLSPTPTQQIVVPSTCIGGSASFNPNAVAQGGRTTFSASGFAQHSPVTLQLIGPGNSTQFINAQSNSICQVTVGIDVLFNDPLGSYVMQAFGTAYTGGSLTLSASFVVTGAAPPPFVPTGPTVTPTSSIICGTSSAFISSPQLTRGQSTTFGGSGFRPGSIVTAQFEDPAGPFPILSLTDQQLGPAATTCSVAGTFVVNQAINPGRYRITLVGQNHLGTTVSPRVEFEVVADQTAVMTPTATSVTAPPPPPPPPPPPGPSVPVLPGGPAPIVVDQTLTIVGGSQVPAVGQTSLYDHVIRLTNNSTQAMRFSIVAGMGEALLEAAAQGQGATVRFTTDYTDDVRVVRASSNIGQASVRGASVLWEGQLGAGQSVDLRTSFEQTPLVALTINQPVRGQTMSVLDPRGATLSVPPIQPPMLPPAQRLVQPAPPRVDPVTGSRYFESTGFSVGNDDIWVYYHRRGGVRTFGAPISRLFPLSGRQVQLFEGGLLSVDDLGRVTAINLLEDPFLPYETIGDLRLPAVDEFLIVTSPDPAAPNYGDATQEFVSTYSPERYERLLPRYYVAFLSTVQFRDAFFDGIGDPNLIPGFNLEIWGLPTSRPSYQVIGYRTEADGTQTEILNTDRLLLRYQRGLLQHDAQTGRTTQVRIGYALKALMTGQTDNPDFASIASTSYLWAQYNPEAVNWIDRPDDLPDTNLVLVFEPE